MTDISPGFAGAYNKYSVSAQRHIDDALEFVNQFEIAVQAGGHAGQFPIYLAQHFKAVYTWEPVPQDFVDLVHNIAFAGVSDKVFASRGMLGEIGGTGEVTNGASGSNKRLRGIPGNCPIYKIDDLNLSVCNLMYFDVEGDEIYILRGAIETLRRCRPVVAVEERAKFAETGKIEEFLTALNYQKVGSHSSDTIWRMNNE